MAQNGLSGDVKAVFALSVALMILAALLDSGAVGWIVAPIVLLGFTFCAVRVPLRYSLYALMVMAFTLDNPVDRFAGGLYVSPLYKVGAAMFDHLNNLTGIKALFFSGSDIILLILGIIGIARQSSGSRVDAADRHPTPRQHVRLAQIALVGAGYVWLWGMLRGGEFSWSLWQLQRVVYLPLLFLLFHLALRGPKDYAALAKVVLGAAVTRAVLAILIRRFVEAEYNPETGLAELPYATSHADSMLFASAFVLLVLMVLEKSHPKARRYALWFIPVLALGMVANNRRLVWVHVALILVTLYVISPDNRHKKKFRRSVLLASPLLALYMMAGWNSHFGALFKPVRMARSIVEPTTDGSSLWRELENYNLIVTLKQSPIMGYGYGRRFIEDAPLPAVDYSLEYYCPHNSLLGLWAFAGYVGYTAITLMWGVGVYFAMRGYHAAKTPADRAAAIVSVGAVLVYMLQAFGDLGLGSQTGIFILAPALAMAGKIAVSTGAWGARPAAAGGGKTEEKPPAVARGFAGGFSAR
jgi:hypothetical protein